MSARQPFVALLAVLRVCAFERCIWRVWIVTENPLKYVCTRALTATSVSKRRRISCETQKSIALGGPLFAGKSYHANWCNVRNRSISFSCQSARVTLTHFVLTCSIIGQFSSEISSRGIIVCIYYLFIILVRCKASMG